MFFTRTIDDLSVLHENQFFSFFLSKMYLSESFKEVTQMKVIN